MPEDWDQAWNAEYRRVFDEQLEAVPGIAETIKAIAAEGFQMCVASSGSHEKMRRTVEDSRYGVAGAKAAGMLAIGFAGGITPAAHLEAAEVVITDMADLPGEVARLLC